MQNRLCIVAGILFILALQSCDIMVDFTRTGGGSIPGTGAETTADLRLAWDGSASGVALRRGKVLEVSWPPRNGDGPVRLDLFRNGSLHSASLADYQTLPGRLAWRVPEALPGEAGDNFFLVLSVYDPAVQDRLLRRLESVRFTVGLPDPSGLSDVIATSTSLRLTLVDNGSAIDGDRVSLVLNGLPLVTDHSLLATPGTTIDVALQRGSNLLEIVALNEGSQSPNTAQLRLEGIQSGQCEQSWRLFQGQRAHLAIWCP